MNDRHPAAATAPARPAGTVADRVRPSRGARRVRLRHLPRLVPLCVLALAACAAGPDYHRPVQPLPATFAEAAAWRTAQPADDQPGGAWWTRFHDPVLDALQAQALKANPDVAAAEAHYRQALASVDQSWAALFPTVSLSGGVSRSANGVPGLKSSASTLNSASVGASWVPDLWGGVRRALEAARANAGASRANLGAAQLSLQSTLATDYFALRIANAQQLALDEAVQADQRSLELTQSRFRGGIAARSDVAQAQAQLEATRAQAIDLGITRGQLLHALAVLVGQVPEGFSLPAATVADVPAVPAVPPQLPLTLLERRPDVAAAERAAAAANAQIGVAQAAFFPALTLSASGGYRAPAGSTLFSAPFRTWTLGPSLAETLFDAGNRLAARRAAVAGYDAAAAAYRKAVLAALQNVEDQLLALRVLEEEARVQEAALAAAEETLRLTIAQYKGGTVSYLNVIVAQTTALNDRVATLNLRGRQLAATVGLMAALGGDWSVQDKVPARQAASAQAAAARP